MTTWALDFESRDYRFLAHESGILPTLQTMVTLTTTADMANCSLASLSDARPEQKESCIEREASAKAAQRWTPWSLENIRQGFIQVGRWVGGLLVSLFQLTRGGDGDGDRDADMMTVTMLCTVVSALHCNCTIMYCSLASLDEGLDRQSG